MYSFELPTGTSGDKCAIKMEVENATAQGKIPCETQPLLGAAGVVKILFAMLTLQWGVNCASDQTDNSL